MTYQPIAIVRKHNVEPDQQTSEPCLTLRVNGATKMSKGWVSINC